MNPPGQSNIEALHTSTPKSVSFLDLIQDIYIGGR